MINGKDVSVLREAYGLFKGARGEITDVAVRGYYAFGRNLSGEVAVFPVGRVFTDTFLGNEIIVTSIRRRGGIMAAAAPGGRGYVSDSREVIVDFNYPHEEKIHNISVKATGNVTRDGSIVIAQNFGVPLPLKRKRHRNERLVDIGMEADTGLAVADTIDSVSHKLLGTEYAGQERQHLSTAILLFSAARLDE